ncbi:MAG: lysophospholipid acyltransferase family protein [Planctomycetota bacterium]
MSTENKSMRWYWFATTLCRWFCRFFLRLRYYGLENIPVNGGVVLISNHQSFLDPVFCGIELKRPLYFLARDSLFTDSFTGRLITSLNTIPVRRGQADLTAMKNVIGKLKAGFGVCLFPEATRTRDGKISPFKPGFGLVCRRGNAAVVPVVIEGAFECWPRHKKMPALGSKISICYGQAIPAEQIKTMTDRELADKLTAKLRQMQNDCRARMGKEPIKY